MKRPRSDTAASAQLPVFQARHRILSAMNESDVLVVLSETGSGKTTTLPQLVLDDRDARKSRIVVTQPRRVAAITVACRVAEERKAKLGDEVGYAVRFDDKSSPTRTLIRYVTDGVLLREMLNPKGLARYSHVFVDEVHERSINTDIVLGMLKQALLRHEGVATRPKAVLMSATTDAQKLKRFFETKSQLRVRVVDVPGRAFPVKTLYTAEPVQDFVDAAVTAALQVHVDYALDGDILAFLPGQEEISAAITLLGERVRRHLPKPMAKSLVALPLYASLSPSDQMAAIAQLAPVAGRARRKVIFATNVAETSVTIPGIKYVIDAGLSKIRSMQSVRHIKIDALRLGSISQAQADQRKGRAGRTGPGLVFRLYTEAQFDEMDAFPVPEILRVDAASSILQILACDNAAKGRGLRKFPFLDAPRKATLATALETLHALGAVDDDMSITQTGLVMAQIPTTPTLARSLLEAAARGCVEDLVPVAAMLSVDGALFLTPQAQRETARTAHRRFRSPDGDHRTLLNAYRAFEAQRGEDARTEFCKDHFLNKRTLSSAASICKQLKAIMHSSKATSWVTERKTANIADADPSEGGSDDDDHMRKCLAAGFFRNAAKRREESGKYVLLSSAAGFDAEVSIHPTSALFTGSARKGPEFVVFDELVLTTKPYMRTVSAVDEAWLRPARSRLCEVSA